MISEEIIQNTKIEYWQKGKGEYLLFLHGAFSSFRFYLPLLERFARHYTVLAPTLPGMGKSESFGKGNTLSKYIEVISEFIHRKIGTQEFVLVGHSLGGGIGVLLLKSGKVKVRKMILLNPVGQKIKNYFLRTIIGWLSTIIIHIKDISYRGKTEIIPWDLQNIILRRPIEFIRIIRLLQQFEITNEIIDNRFLKECRIFTAYDDRYILPHHAEYLKNLIPQSTVLYQKNGGHIWFMYHDNFKKLFS
jgi:pimeloyl-ACP methyl ester carboxylesterase